MIRPRLIILTLLSILLLSATGVQAQSPAPQGTQIGSGFTYQGQLKKQGKLFDGTCDFQFSLYDVAVGGNQAGSLLTQAGVKVVDGVFAAKLDFGASVFTGEARWLQVAVKCPGDEGFVIFNTRQELTPTPYAIGLLPGATVRGGGGTNTLTGISDSGRGLQGVSTTDIGVAGFSTSSHGMYGFSTNDIGVLGDSPNGRAVVGFAGKSTGVEGDSTDGTGVVGTSKNGRGVVGITTAATAVEGNSTNGAGIWGSSDNSSGVVGVSKTFVGVYGRSDSHEGVIGESNTGAGVSGISKSYFGVYGKSDTGYAGFFEGKVRVKTLEIAGGADLAEPFDVNSANNTAIIPGIVVCIDPTNPGKLVVCANAYDRTVAGVISGAGGVQPGMVMRQDGSAADGQHPVALTGRVYVWADATRQPIHPGDLLTTSATSGHAAKATDYDAAQGAIIGKAMGTLESGKGLVLVLVALN